MPKQSSLDILTQQARDFYQPYDDTHSRGTLCHYTDAKGLYGIIKDKKLWATHLSFVNDPREVTAGLEVLRRILATLRPKARSYRRDSDFHFFSLFQPVCEYCDGSLLTRCCSGSWYD